MPHSLSPEDIDKVGFHRTLRGYARDEVLEFVEGVRELVHQLQEKADTGYLNLGEKMGELLQQAKDGADDLTANARAEATRAVEEARALATRLEDEARTRATDTVETAETHAAKIVQEAEARVSELRTTEEAIRTELRSLRAKLEGVTASLLPLEQSHAGVEREVDLSPEELSGKAILTEKQPERADVGVE